MVESKAEESALDSNQPIKECIATSARQALELARHELTTLHGLLAADGMAPSEIWSIDTGEVVAKIDTVLSEFSRKESLPS